MADERVVIKIDVKADTAAIDRVRLKLAALCAQADECSDTFDKLGTSLDDAGDSQKRFNKDQDNTSNKLKKTGRAAEKTAKVLSTALKFAMIGSAIETAGLAVALSSVNGLLATGRFLVKGYHVAMSALAKAAAAAGVALATFAAAQRQFVAAQQAGRYGGFQASSYALRTMTADARLAGVSIKSLNQAFLAASKNAKVTGATSSAIAGLMDFAAISGDIEKGVSQVATLVSLVQKGGAGGAGVAEAAKQLGPEFEKAFKEVTKGGKASAQEVLQAFSSGQLAKQAGIGGTFSAMQGTLIGQFKAFVSEMQTNFADLGSHFIQPVQLAFEEIRRIMVRTFTQMSPIVMDFARGGLLDKVVNGIDKIAQFLIKLMREYVPATQSFFGKLSDFWNRLTGGFERFNGYLRGLSDSSKVINKFFGKILGAIGGGLRKNFEQFSRQVVSNEDNLMKWGDALSRLIDAIFNLSRAFRDAFFSALPVMTRIADIFTMIVNSIAKIIDGLSKMGRLLGSIIGLGSQGEAVGGFLGYMGLPLLLGGFGRMAKGKAFMGPGMKKMGSALASPLGITAMAALGTQALTNRGNTAVETAGDIGTGAIVGAGVGKYALGAIQNAATNAYVMGQTAAEAGGRFAGAGGKLAGAAARVGSLSAGQVMGAGALLAGGAVATHVGSNLVSDAVYRASGGNRYLATATGATTGALTGAATGAALTAWLGPGAAGGALVGAIIGSLWGGINGFMQDRKYKKQAKKAAQTFVTEYSSLVEEALSKNDVRGATQLIDDFSKNAQKMANTQVKSGTARNEAEKKWKETSEDLINTATLMTARFTDLEKISGLTTDQVQELANSAEVDLGSSMMTLQEILQATGIATARFGQTFSDALIDTYGTAVSKIRQTLEIVQAPDVYAASGRAFGEKARAGTLTDEDRAKFFEDIFQQNLLLAGGDPLKAYESIYREYGNVGRPGGQFSVKQGKRVGDLYGLQDAFYGGAGGAIWSAAFGELGGGVAGLTAENIISEAARMGRDVGMSKDQLTSALASMSPDKLIEIARATSAGEFLKPEAQYAAYGGLVKGQTIEEQLTKVLGSELTDKFKVQETVSFQMKEAATGFKNAKDGFARAVELFGEAVQLFKDAQGSGDTRTPRRNMVDTIGAHNRLNSLIAGRRVITSGYRTHSLGSINSDHAAGRAYDLVGQNLGLYQASIRATGGYADFHGNGASRHLHVVPNSPAIGDTASPSFSSQPMPAPASSGTMTVNMTVNASPGMDVQMLASEVLARIEAAQASWQERG